jgi:multiple sugar transport system ATP-binding protein
MSAPFLSVRGLTKGFGRTSALAGVDIDVADGEFVAVLGPTGAGKTTLLRCIAGLDAPDEGAISIGGRDASQLAPPERDVALVFQNFSLYPSMTVRENLEFPLRAPARRMPAAQIAERVGWAAELLSIRALLDRPAGRLSGGEMQRVAIGRAIVRRPRLFLMDEPLTNLDAKLRESLRYELKELARRLATPVVWATHDAVEALAMADRLVLLDRGRVLQSGAPSDVHERPSSPAAARLFGWPPVNEIPARRVDGWWTAPDGTRIARAETNGADEAVLGLRPEHLALDGGPCEAAIEVVELLGPAQVAVLRWAGVRATAIVPRERPLAIGALVAPRADADRLIIWPRT